MPKISLGYSQKRYSSQVKAEAKFMRVDKEMSYTQISNHFNGHPSASQVRIWAQKKDPVSKISWEDELKMKAKDKYRKLSPQSQAQGLMDALDHIIIKLGAKLKTGDGNVKELSTMADSLSKVNKTLEKIVDKKFQIPMLYEFLENFISFLALHYKQLITPEFINAVKHFKNETRKKLEF